MTGRLIGIARRSAHRAPMETAERARITVEGGVEGDDRGPKYPKRRVTVLTREGWEAALAELPDDAAGLPWTARRANLLIEGVRLPHTAGGIFTVGPVRFEITYETNPCKRMDEAYPGLLKALHPDWRGGVCCAVLDGGEVSIGDPVVVEHAPIERRRVLPG